MSINSKPTKLAYANSKGAMAKIEIEAYNKKWPILYDLEKDLILKLVAYYLIDIQHIGSTAIPGLAAKPTIDICIGINSLSDKAVAPIINGLKTLNYAYLPFLEASIPQRKYLQKLDLTGKHLIHIHIVKIKGKLWNEYIRFRDYLLAHPLEQKKYEQLKLNLQQRFTNDRENYTSHKAGYIKSILNKANAWYLGNHKNTKK